MWTECKEIWGIEISPLISHEHFPSNASTINAYIKIEILYIDIPLIAPKSNKMLDVCARHNRATLAPKDNPFKHNNLNLKIDRINKKLAYWSWVFNRWDQAIDNEIEIL